MKHLLSPAAALLIAWLALVPCACGADPAAALESLDRHFAQQLAVLAEKCDSLQLPTQATITRDWQVRRTPGRHLLFIPPVSDPHEPASATPEIVKNWYRKFRELRTERAASLYTIAEDFLATGDSAAAYRLLHEVLRENPDHKPARDALGYVSLKGKPAWSSHAAPPLPAVGRTDHAKTGWQSGKYWRIETPRWRIATNHSAAAGLDLARKLEDFHLLWRQLFFEFAYSAADLRAAMASRVRLPEPRAPMNVYLFKNRDEYVKFLKPNHPEIAITQGLYADEQQTAVFYAGDETVQATWYHEAAHQLFQQWRDTPQGVGKEHNFWLVEGAAMYVESLTNHGSHWTAGGWQADRLQIARYRVLARDFNPPFQQLTQLGREGVQQSPEIRKLYGHFAATSHFLFDHPDLAYRQAGQALLRELYAQRDKPDSLVALTGASYGELDDAFLKSLQVTDANLLQTPGLEKVRNLALGRTQVTDKGLAAVAVCRELRWLDLSGLTVGDEGLEELKQAAKLQQLFLDGSRVTGESLPFIAQFSTLEELDLSNLQLAEESLAPLAKLRKLKILHLTGTPIGDTAIQHLKNLSSLESLDVSGTKLTPAGLMRLKGLLPKTAIE